MLQLSALDRFQLPLMLQFLLMLQFFADAAVVAAVAAADNTIGAGAAFLARLLQYMETPQYLRRYAADREALR